MASSTLLKTLTLSGCSHRLSLSLSLSLSASKPPLLSLKPRAAATMTMALHFAPSLNPSSRYSPLIAHASAWASEDASVAVDDDTWKSDGEAGESEGVFEERDEEPEYSEYSEPPEEAKVFVGNLSYDVDSQRLAMLFEKAGVVEISEVIYNRETDRSRGFGFVTMSTVEEADKAVEMFNRYDLDGRLLTVNKAAPKGSRPERAPRSFEPAFRLYVGNLPWDADNGRLEQVFSKHGKVVEARVVYDRETGRSRGFGFVTMSTESEMEDAISGLDGQTMDGRAIRVNVAEERPRRSF